MSRPTGEEKNGLPGVRYRVNVIPSPDDRWTVFVHFEHGNDPERTRRANAAYATRQEADVRGMRYGLRES